MIDSISGKIFKKEPTMLFIQNGGVVFSISICLRDYEKLPKEGESVFIFTYLNVKENLMELYGFLDLERRSLFSNLIDAGYVTEENTFNFTYKRVIGRSLFASMKPTVHQYDLTRLRSPLIEIDAKEWPLALYLPTEAFKKKDKTFVWEESLNRI